MTVTEHIINIALNQNGLFTRKDILNTIRPEDTKVSEGSLAVLLSRMLANDKITRVSHGIYRLNEHVKHDFSYSPNGFMQVLNKQIRTNFPFIDYCLWQPSVFGTFMQHVPAVRMTLIDVKREAMESVFMSLQGTETKLSIHLNPSQKDIDRYITNNEVIIVRPLVKEAPLNMVDNCPVPTLEKMLVDAIADKELQYLQGNELYTIYTNALTDYNIKKARLLRYASRRNRKSKVEQILNTIQIL